MTVIVLAIMASRSLAWSLGVYSFTGFLGLHLSFLSSVSIVKIVGAFGPPLVILIGARSAVPYILPKLLGFLCPFFWV